MASESDDFILCDKNQFRSPSLDAPEYSMEIAKEVFEFHQTIPGYKPTPFVELDNLAKKCKVAKICVKDESKRFDLNAYKFLGVSYAIAKEILYQNEEFTWSNMVQKVAQMEQKPIFITATDGNHGYGLAYAAKILNCQAIIFMPKDTVDTRIERTKKLGADVRKLPLGFDETVIEARQFSHSLKYFDTVEGRIERTKKLGADVRKLPLGYDETVIEARQETSKLETKARGKVLFIQDTTLEGYWDIPLTIMQGYSTILSEAWISGHFDDLQRCPTHVFLQVGVGTFSGGMTGFLINKMAELGTEIKIVTVEPRGAHCVFNSHRVGDGQLHEMEGDLVTIMAGLNCGVPSGLGWPILKSTAFAFMSCVDEVTKQGMRLYYYPIAGDSRIISGESGAVTLGALHHICTKNEAMRKQLELDETSRILLVSTEGDTDPDGFRQIVLQEGQ